MSAARKVMDVNFINPFLDATMKTLETQASTKAVAGAVFMKSKSDKFAGDISGVIGLISDAFTGSVVISFPAETFLKVMTRMLGEECNEINDMIRDGAGELTNIIFGQAKIVLNKQGFGIKTALPSVIAGHDHSVVPMTQGPRVVIPFTTDVGPFFVEICLST
jgi:chemotaxis protein CheX